MLIIPAIDLRNGKCVRLLQGNFNKETIYSDAPTAVAKKWEAQGAQMLHLVDLDGAKNGTFLNLKIVQKIVKAVKIPIQIGGGIRVLEDLENLFNAGVARVVIGTLAFENESLLKAILAKFSKQVAVALDVKNGILVKRGWQESTDKDLIQTIKYLKTLGVERLIFTDVSKDGTLTSPNYKEIENLLKNTQVPVIAGGGISALFDIKKLKKIGAEGAILGKALYEGRISLKEAINVS